MNNNNNNNLMRDCTREKEMEEGKAVHVNHISTTATTTTTTMATTTNHQACRRFPKHSTIGTLTTSSTAYKWNSNINDNNYYNNRKTYNNNNSLPVSSPSSWVNDPEIKRQRRIAKYKAYAVEGKMKSSIRSGFRWVKNKYCQLVHGY